MDLAPLLCVIRTMEMSLFFLIRRLLLVIPVISTVYVIFATSSVSCVDFLIILLLLRGLLTVGLKKSSLGLRSLNAYVSSSKQIDHHSGLLHGDLLHSLDVIDSVMESIDNLDVLDVRGGIPGIAKTFYVVLDALIMLLHDGLQSLSSRWTLVCILEVPDKYDT
jgi:hypothetical protein